MTPFESATAATASVESSALLENVGCGIWVYDGVDTRYVNRAMETITGYTREELLQPQFFAALIQPQFKDMLVERGKARVRGEEVPERYEIAITAKDGSTRWLTLHARRVELEFGAASLVSAADTTELKRAQGALADGTRLVREVLDNIPASIITTDPRGKPTFVNRFWLDYTGMSLAEAMDAGTRPVIHPDDVRRSAAAWRAALESDTAYEIDYRIRRRDGTYRWNNFRIRPVRNSEEEMVGWTSASVDVDESRTFQAMLEAANERLLEANRAKDEILDLVSHELRTPLTTILGSASALRRHGDTLAADDRMRLAEEIETDARRLHAIIENMLILSNSDADRAREGLEPLLLGHLAREVCAEFEHRTAGARVTVDIVPGLRPVLANPTHVRQVITNLLSNGHKYGSPGKPVRVRIEDGGAAVRCVVANEGEHIAPEALPRIFDPFYRSPASQDRVFGVGLGLTVCQRLIERGGGQIGVENVDGGVAFSILMPAIAPEASDL